MRTNIVVHLDTLSCIKADFNDRPGQEFVEYLADNIDKRYGHLLIVNYDGGGFVVSVSDCLTEEKARATKRAVDRQIEYCLAAWEG